MQFKHPELLYALSLLLIPIIIHLFQLRRFQKVDFTNVAFLKKVTIQTRKSSQLKKWLILLARLAAMTCLIVAFAQPFTASKNSLNNQKEIVLYLDNSFSMQAKGSQGPLLQRAIHDLYEQPFNSSKISWFTNDFSKKGSSLEDFKNDILKVSYTQNQFTTSEVLLKANQLFSKDLDSQKQLIIVSDFQSKDAFAEVPSELLVHAVQLKPIIKSNIVIDTAYIVSKNSDGMKLNVVLSSQGKDVKSTPLSLFNETTLVAKTALDFSQNSTNTITFDLETNSAFKGKLVLNEPNLIFDNTLFFSINIPQKIKVLSINDGDAKFIQRLFDQPEFEYSQQSFKSLNYNDIPSQNFIILNELDDIPVSLTTAINSFISDGGSLFIIPSMMANIENYNILLNSFELGSFSENILQEKKITNIVFDHPLYRNVFEKRVVNFQYPVVNSFFNINSNASSVLNFEDGKAFILQNKNTYVCTASLNSINSNFQNSPLIVPTLYNMAQQSLPLPELYYLVGKQNKFSVSIALIQDEILTIRDSSMTFIPLQQTKANQVNITTNDAPSTSGNFQIQKEKEFIENVSYNYNREESILQYADVEKWQGVKLFKNVDDLFNDLAEENTINSFWKWFTIFALLFLMIEMIILKFYK